MTMEKNIDNIQGYGCGCVLSSRSRTHILTRLETPSPFRLASALSSERVESSSFTVTTRSFRNTRSFGRGRKSSIILALSKSTSAGSSVYVICFFITLLSFPPIGCSKYSNITCPIGEPDGHNFIIDLAQTEISLFVAAVSHINENHTLFVPKRLLSLVKRDAMLGDVLTVLAIVPLEVWRLHVTNVIQKQLHFKQNPFDKSVRLWQGEGTTNLKRFFRPDSSGFFVPSFREEFRQQYGGVNRAEYNTRKGNKPSRLEAVVETSSPHIVTKLLNLKEAQMEKQISQTPVVPVVTIVKNQTTTTSLNVAEVFGKQHKNVLQSIEALDVPKDFGRLNFQPSSYTNTQGKDQPMYNMTRDGFTILVMGFTGKKAIKFKISYINAFNRMEAEILKQKGITDHSQALTPAQQREVQSLISERVYSLPDKREYRSGFRKMYGLIKTEFKVGSYKDLPSDRFDELVRFIESVNINIPALNQQNTGKDDWTFNLEAREQYPFLKGVVADLNEIAERKYPYEGAMFIMLSQIRVAILKELASQAARIRSLVS